jgi:hypothetical protein
MEKNKFYINTRGIYLIYCSLKCSYKKFICCYSCEENCKDCAFLDKREIYSSSLNEDKILKYCGYSFPDKKSLILNLIIEGKRHVRRTF